MNLWVVKRNLENAKVKRFHERMNNILRAYDVYLEMDFLKQGS